MPILKSPFDLSNIPFSSYSITPIINIVQTFLNEDKLYHAIADLPDNMDFIGTVMSIATHPKFKVLESMRILVYFLFIFFESQRNLSN